MIFLVALLAAQLEGERVLLVADDPQSEVALRVRDELAADGFDVIARDNDDVIDVLATARELGAAAAVEVHGARIDLWADLTRNERIEHAVVAGADKEVVAVRVAELVRARLLSPRRRRPQVPAAPADALDVRVDAGVGARGELAFAGVPPRAGVDVDGGVDVDRVRLGVVVSVPTVPARINAAAGSADVSLTRFDALLGWRFAAADAVDVVASGGGGATWIHGSGRGSFGQPSHDGDLVVGDVVVGACLAFTVVAPVRFFVDASFGTALPTPVLVVGSDRIAAGPGRAALVAGVSLTYPEAHR